MPRNWTSWLSIARMLASTATIGTAAPLNLARGLATTTTAAAAGGGVASWEEIRYPDGKLRRLSRAWLRFNCRCPDCAHLATQQRSVSPAAALASVRAAAGPRLRYLPGDEGIGLDWPDGHRSEFTFGQLEALLAPEEGRRHRCRSLWRRRSLESASAMATSGATGVEPEQQQQQPPPLLAAARPVRLHEFVSSGGGYRTVLRNLWAYGVAAVTEVEPTEAATEAAVRRMAPVMETLFGRVWTFTSDGSRQDTAYSSEAIGVHNDTTYLCNCAGLQIFHTLEQATIGGETCLADGFQAAETLRKENRRHFDLLVSRPVYHQYLETDGSAASGRLAYHMRCLDSVLKLDPEAGNRPYQIRYNPYDLASLSTLPQEEVPEFLEAYAHLGEILNRQESQVWLNLQPGTVLFIDNWRVLHGRSGFSGRRVLTGCYVSRDAWMSEARVHGVI